MADLIILKVPENIAARARQLAETVVQPVEQILLDHLKALDALWTIAREQVPEDVQARAHTLMDKSSRGVMTDEEHVELDTLVERGDRFMLRKAQAAAMLRKRGHTFTQKDFLPQHG